MARGKYQNSTHIARALSNTQKRAHTVWRNVSLSHAFPCAHHKTDWYAMISNGYWDAHFYRFEYCTIPAYLPLSLHPPFSVISASEFFFSSWISVSDFQTFPVLMEHETGRMRDSERERETERGRAAKRHKQRLESSIHTNNIPSQLRCQTLKIIIIPVLCFKIKWKRFSVCGHTPASHPNQCTFHKFIFSL